MSSKKKAGSCVCTDQQPEHSCPRNYKPWIWVLVVMSLVTVAWALYEGGKQDGYVNSFISRGAKTGRSNTPSALPAAGGSLVPLASAPGAAGEIQTSYHGIIDAVRPAVVSITAAMRNMPNVANQVVIDPLPADVAFTRIGSGVIIDPRGYLLSSYHVIVGAEALKVTVYGPGGATEFPLKLVKGDVRSDMALLRIQGPGPFSHASLGNSDAIRTCDMVLTIGSPFGLEQSVTSGMISSRNRTLQIGDAVIENLIQTDSSINSGSSGGPMLNVRGEVIGINTAIFAPTGVFNGIGFAIPINRAAELVGGVIDFNNTAPGAVTGQLVAWTSQGRQVGNSYRLPNGQTVIAPHGTLGTCVDCHPQLFEAQTQAVQPAAFMGPGSWRGGGFYGRGQMSGVPYNGVAPQMAYSEPLMGVGLVDVDDVICRQARMLHPEGVLVTGVTPGAPASSAGVQPGDILVRIGGRKILNINSLNTLLAAQNIGRRFDLVYLRNGSRQSIRIKIGTRNQAANAQVQQPAQ
ncbi:MAG: S1C family serine protease [Desulfuromonadaceae bacterium]